MITSLSIENFALIEKLSINFSNGFSTITGETGAGKSIILGALGLALGKRADLSSLKNKEEKCIIEVHFNIENYNLQSFFEINNLDYEDDTIIRREILPTGKSRAFINDTPVNLQDLQDLSHSLVDIHSQNDAQDLGNNTFQFEVLDAVSSVKEELLLYRCLLKEYKTAKNDLASKTEALLVVRKEQDYNSFLYNELVEAKLISDEQESLETEFEKLSNVEFIKENFQRVILLTSDEQFGLTTNLNEAKIALQKTATFSKEYNDLLERMVSISIELDDIEKEIESKAENLNSNPTELERINQKLQLIYTLQKKHQVNTIDELLAIEKELESKVSSVENLENEIEKIQLYISKLENELNTIAETISNKRKKAIPELISKTCSILEQLGMPNAQLKIELNSAQKFAQNGKDEIEFLLSANKGLEFGLIKKVASGGEMSRIMLAIKSILAQFTKLPTIIFDEIDTGVSGEIANKMGEIMLEMSKTIQVFSITHLPQIAAKGNNHFKVYKYEENNTTNSELKLLNTNERELEIAEMLSGKSISESALIHAKALLN